jgi:hypothetical protein
MKRLNLIGLITFLSLIFNTSLLNSQVIRCGTVENDSIRRTLNPNLESKEAFEAWMAEMLEERKTKKIIGDVYQIPVVFHVIHNNQAVGTGANLSYAVLQSQIDVLNEDFRKILGSNGYNTHPDGADTKIEFCLAQRRPDGSAFPGGENGVNRINRSTAGFTAPPYSSNYYESTIKPYTYNSGTPTATRGWVPTKYLNIWVSDLSGGLLGYAQFPTSALGGMGCGSQSLATDGVVFLYSSIGKSSVSGFAGPYNEGRTATHEIGHWLGLRHIWADDNGGCTQDDYCADTPFAGDANYGCPTGTNSCTSQPSSDMIENYMDYTDDDCMNIFTYDQKNRMRVVLENTRASLINSDACIPPSTNDASIVDIFNPKGDNCAGAITPSVSIRNRGTATLTAATINYKIDNGPITIFSWTGSLTTGSSATAALPSFTTTLGVHTITVYSTLPNGAADPNPTYDTTKVSFVVSNGIMAPYTQDFEASVFPPDLKWTVDNPNSDCYEWISASATSIAGVVNNNVAQMPSFSNSTTGTENLITPIFILPCNATAANIQFDVAYKRRNTTVTNYERLYVDISTDCGGTWNATPIYDKAGTVLNVITTTQTTEYFPSAANHWRTETIDLLSFVGATSKNVRFRFRAVAANGNNVFIDNFKFNATTTGEVKVTQATSEVLDGGAWDFGTTNAGTPVNVTYTVTNTGTTTLSLTNPTITGSGFTVGNFGSTSLAAGATTTFTVTFNPTLNGTNNATLSFGNNDCDENTFDINLTGNGIGVSAASSFSMSNSSICAGQTVTYTNTSLPATTYAWNFGAGATPATANTVGPHTVTYATGGSKTITLTTDGTNNSTQTVTVNALPTVTTNANQTVCQGTNVTLTGAGANSYTWDNGISNNVAFAANATTTYTVTGTDNNGCTATAQTTLTVNPGPTVNAGTDVSICAGQPTSLTASGNASSYTWNNGATQGGSVSPANTTTYTATGTAANGCTTTDQVIVTIKPLPILTLNNTTACSYWAPYSLTIANPSGGTYTGTGITNNTFDPSVAGVGTVNVTYAFTNQTTGCSNTAQAIITVATCAGIEENEMLSYKIFPNPAKEQLNIEISEDTFKEIKMYDNAGKLIKVIHFNSPENKTQISLEQMAGGIYHIEIYGTSQMARTRILKQ